MTKVTESKMTTDFSDQLLSYKKLIDDDLLVYSDHVVTQTKKTYGDTAADVAKAYAEILKRGGKRIRGILTLVGYRMCGGKDEVMILQAARAIEMMHAYILIIDDIQDESATRRNGPAAHKLLKQTHHGVEWRGNSDHTGEALALNAALLGSHGAQLVLSNLNVDETLRLKALTIMNHTMVVTAHGQTQDIVNAIQNTKVSSRAIEQTMQWKTAHYSVLNPIHMGMVLAGAGCEDTNAITEFALAAGALFQITDDLLIMQPVSTTGKSAIDDIREGKQTLITHYALDHANKEDTAFLRSCLGNDAVSDKDFARCQEIFTQSGAVQHAQKEAKRSHKDAQAALKKHKHRWDEEYVQFLESLVVSFLDRTQ